jgi:uncharacterized iron-regulated membrane protein
MGKTIWLLSFLSNSKALTMKAKELRDTAFAFHRYLGLVTGLILIIIGLTGSILVFYHEIDQFILTQRFGQVVLQGERLSYESILNNVKANYSNQPDLKISWLDIPTEPAKPVAVSVELKKDESTEVYVNPYTGTIMGARQWDKSFFGYVYKLHYELLAGQVGIVIAGIAALLLFILSLTGIILWPGWRKLIAGFKIKWNAHPKRLNFDLHKVVGIITATFLAMIAFTGFCWNFWEQTEPLIYAATFTPKPVEPASKSIPGKMTLGLTEILQRTDTALPGSETTSVGLPDGPTGVFRINRKRPEEINRWGDSTVYLDQYSGEVLQIQDSRTAKLGDRVVNSFAPMHYGTFGGVWTRILYVFVGLAPTALFVTGLIMWRYRKQPASKSIKPIDSFLLR